MATVLNYPLVKGKTVTTDEALKKAKQLVISSKSIHIDGLACDNNGLKSIFKFAEKYNASVDHMDGQKNADLNDTIQRYGGFFSSFGEIYHRCELILFIGFKKSLPDEFKHLKKGLKRPKIIFFDGKFKVNNREICLDIKKNKIVEIIKQITDSLNQKKQSKEFVVKEIIKFINTSNYTTIIYSSLNDKELTTEIFRLVRNLNDGNIKTSILSYNGSNNLSGAVQYSLWKTGYPLRIQFTENGPVYNPIEINSENLSKKKELQIFISCFDFKSKPNMFRKNIFIGNPNQLKKKDFDIFLPTKIPGINKSGIVHRGDGIGIKKLKKISDSKNLSVEDIINLIS